MVISEDYNFVGLTCAFGTSPQGGPFTAKITFPRAGIYLLSMVFTPTRDPPPPPETGIENDLVNAVRGFESRWGCSIPFVF
jgi:hypothetical protein